MSLNTYCKLRNVGELLETSIVLSAYGGQSIAPLGVVTVLAETGKNPAEVVFCDS